MKVSDFDFPLPEGLVAYEPAAVRDLSRLMVLERATGAIRHQRFADLPDFLRPGDMLILNDTKVTPCRLLGRKPTGGKLEMVLVRPHAEQGCYDVLMRGTYQGPVEFSERLRGHVGPGHRVRLESTGDLRDALWEAGSMPLPPYIKRQPDARDKERYQTVYALHEGSVAAPTAGLHFTDSLLARIEAMGVRVRRLTLHVGMGTFMPIKVENIHDHAMQHESFTIALSLIEEIKAQRASGGRVITVGTTATRALEGYLSGRYQPLPGGPGERNGYVSGSTDIFISPGYEFRAATAIVTNFHLPRSTPLFLAAAVAGKGFLMRAYAEAIGETYRFFSYGDAMLIL